MNTQYINLSACLYSTCRFQNATNWSQYGLWTHASLWVPEAIFANCFTGIRAKWNNCFIWSGGTSSSFCDERNKNGTLSIFLIASSDGQTSLQRNVKWRAIGMTLGINFGYDKNEWWTEGPYRAYNTQKRVFNNQGADLKNQEPEMSKKKKSIPYQSSVPLNEWPLHHQ